jgi:GNAT superfamily N-acetyltransferase
MIVRRAVPADRLSLCVTAMRAFVDDPVMRWLYPEDEVFLEPGGEVLRPAMTGWIALGEVWCTDDGAAGAVWIPPGRPDIDFTVDPPPEPHWYLQLLATHPDWQRRGLGAALMAVMFERADAEGLPCYLETETIDNVAYYRRHGFEVRSEWDVPTGPHMWGMLRPSS